MNQSTYLLQPVYEKWEVQKIFDLVKNNEFKNPLVNRKKKWVIHSHKPKKQSNYNDYIDFLFLTGSTVENITLARMCDKEKIYYVNIDGNNRLNALLYFFKYPFLSYNTIFDVLILLVNLKVFSNLFCPSSFCSRSYVRL